MSPETTVCTAVRGVDVLVALDVRAEAFVLAVWGPGITSRWPA